MSSILFDSGAKTGSFASSGSYADVNGLASGSVTVDSASNVILLIASVPVARADDGNTIARFDLDGTLVGPEMVCFADNASVDDMCGFSICYALTTDAGSHTFGLQWITIATNNSTHATRERRMFVIEISNSSLIVDDKPTAVQAASATYADIPDMVENVAVTSGSVHVFLANLTADINDAAAHEVMGLRMAVDGTPEGPDTEVFKDASDEGCGQSFMWMRTGLTGTVDLDLQWKETNGAVDSEDGRVRSWQVIEITSDFQLQANDAPVTSHTYSATGYADIPNMTVSFAADSTNSIIIMAGHSNVVQSSDETATIRFADDGTSEGGEVFIFTDSGSGYEKCSHSVYHAKTPPNTSSHTYTLQGELVQATPDVDTALERGFCILELKAGAALTTEYVGPISQMESGGFIGTVVI